MKKKKNLASKEKPILKTVTILSKERGLDPAQLEKEAVEHRFGATVSGVLTIDETRYDAWVVNQIEYPPKKKNSDQKSLSESNSIGLLRANMARLTEHLHKDEDSLKWLDEDLASKSEGIDKKMAQKKRNELLNKIDNKRQLIGDAERRLHFILDREIGDSESSIFDNLEDEERSLSDPGDEDPTVEQ